ncbi:TIGR03759 family integrating conjugative element protein [Vibrio parahaemolyticus]|uniref:TIGR03759 family integrating conjugative element protein n=1 Tax=Vibrio parahaemolyticus TaxID=670 RepID=UPI00215D0843|nr:TIGR03759 family integrating conjugative element protein [Vibrio parahaemolyticus]MCR9780669.1 TIGR03759 family integrating conjugative element protein [Vibrio parahaemolyticus]MCZ5880457.1 TIGR03759 family integrating conjugative element protein [Vibrio parahaemolyticus]MCZ6298628.1 TIGR03759 family integrating conjugative element protein [Vibrio parahaemolyticus]MCZ6371810.1 TIGR03759 family integrating conjugative element protein [Vibrio parahaemolyticus]
MNRLRFVTALLLMTPGVWAGNTASVKHAVQTTQSQTGQSQSLELGGDYWQLSKADWQRYETLMESPLTYDMKNDNPIEVLATFARNEEERRRFAERLVEFDKKRTDGLLALDVAYRQAWHRLYPNLKPIGQRWPSRVALFVRAECDECVDALKNWRQHGVSVDVYLVGDGSDDALQTWANRAGVRQSDVEQHYITLNHDKQGLWFRLAKGKAVPVAAAERGGQWSVIAQP